LEGNSKVMPPKEGEEERGKKEKQLSTKRWEKSAGNDVQQGWEWIIKGVWKDGHNWPKKLMKMIAKEKETQVCPFVI
jgi:hypothetical protein